MLILNGEMFLTLQELFSDLSILHTKPDQSRDKIIYVCSSTKVLKIGLAKKEVVKRNSFLAKYNNVRI